MRFIERKWLYLDSNFTEVCLLVQAQSAISQHWFRWWLGAKQVTSHQEMIENLITWYFSLPAPWKATYVVLGKMCRPGSAKVKSVQNFTCYLMCWIILEKLCVLVHMILRNSIILWNTPGYFVMLTHEYLEIDLLPVNKYSQCMYFKASFAKKDWLLEHWLCSANKKVYPIVSMWWNYSLMPKRKLQINPWRVGTELSRFN